MTGIKSKIDNTGYFKKTNKNEYNMFQIEVPNQELKKEGCYTRSIISEDVHLNTPRDEELVDMFFYRILAEKKNGEILKKKVLGDKKFVYAIIGVKEFYYKRYSEEQKDNILKMNPTERLNYFAELGGWNKNAA